MEQVNDLLEQISQKLDMINRRFDKVEDWNMRFNIMEDKITNLEEAVAALKEIKERVIKIEAIISKDS